MQLHTTSTLNISAKCHRAFEKWSPRSAVVASDFGFQSLCSDLPSSNVKGDQHNLKLLVQTMTWLRIQHLTRSRFFAAKAQTVKTRIILNSSGMPPAEGWTHAYPVWRQRRASRGAGNSPREHRLFV